MAKDAKQEAVRCWSADPCGAVEGEPGTKPYLDRLLETRRAYAPWMAEALDYEGTRVRRVLDVGCGQGIDLVEYQLAGAAVVGLDLTPRHVQLARSHLRVAGLAGEVLVGDAEALPFADASFDRVSSNGVLHHTPDMPRALREIQRVLRPGGEARIIVYNRRSFHYWINHVLVDGLLKGGLIQEGSMGALLSRVERSSVGARPLVRVFSPGSLRRLLRCAGFASVTTFVRHFQPEDTVLTFRLRHRLALLRDPALLARLGRVGGWYVTAVGRRV